MREINNEAAENMHVFLLLKVGEKLPFLQSADRKEPLRLSPTFKTP